MGFWGKAIGAGFGFMLGGPLGAVLGGFLGHMYDEEMGSKPQSRIGIRCPYCGHHVKPLSDGHCPICGSDLKATYSSQPQTEFDKQFLFYVTLTSLVAKMAKADGIITRDEIRVFDDFLKKELRLSVEERKIVAQIFNQAKHSPEDPMNFARQFRQLIGHQPEVLHTMIQLLFKIALADGQYHPEEEKFIRQVAQIFGLSSFEFEQIRALFVQVNHKAYQILGVHPQANIAEIKSAYKKLVNQYHPDRLMAKGVPEDFIQLANEKMIEINNAYEQIRKERGF